MIETIAKYQTSEGISIKKPWDKEFDKILSGEALLFLKKLHEKFNTKRKELLIKRIERQKRIDGGELPDFLKETKAIRESDWKIAATPADLMDRRVEITGPVDRKMIINALNSGAKVFMADFEDSNSPTWKNNLEGQINLRDAILKTITYHNVIKNKYYELNSTTATLMVRPRGWHLEEKNVEINGEYISGSLFDFGLYFFHNVKQLLANGSGPYFYLPKLENHLEARLWNEVFEFSQDYLGIPNGTIKATVLIETILASFELDEILYELRHHSAGLNCGRWDYIFSYIKKLHKLDYMLPDRSQVSMSKPFMQSYAKKVVQVCHRRGAHAMGGMAAQIPIKNDPKANEVAMEKVKQDKMQEVQNGHDGTWVAHPGLVNIVTEIFDEYMPTENQINIVKNEPKITSSNLLERPTGTITEKGVRLNINVGILYIESWLRGIGAAAIYNLMEDAATAEISRTQLWQWIHYAAKLDTGEVIDQQMYDRLKEEELIKIKDYVGESNFKNGRFQEAIRLFDDLIKSSKLKEFLTIDAYKLL